MRGLGLNFLPNFAMLVVCSFFPQVWLEFVSYLFSFLLMVREVYFVTAIKVSEYPSVKSNRVAMKYLYCFLMVFI